MEKIGKVMLQAHRGDSAGYPENTIPAFEAAIVQGYDVIELDCKFTSDNVCVVLHDGTVNRTGREADGGVIPDKTPIDSITFAQARELDFGLHKGERFSGTKIPSFAETLSYLRGKNIEVKLDNVFQNFSEERFEIFCRTVADAGMEEQIGMTAKTIPYFKYLAERFPRAQMHYDGSMTPEALAEVSAAAAGRLTLWVPISNASTTWFHGKFADPAYCAEVKKIGKLGIWILKTLPELSDAVNLFGADIIETDGSIKPHMLGEI